MLPPFDAFAFQLCGGKLVEEPFFSHNFAPLPLFLSLAPPSGGWGQERERGEEQGLGFRVWGGLEVTAPLNLEMTPNIFEKPSDGTR